jgi:purine-binding chemotaxis protein CheW
MGNKQYLTFNSQNLQYGIEAALVQEIFPIPELIPIVETETDVIGIINLREQTVPIMHLDLLQENSSKTCKLSDYVIVIQWEGLQLGLVVHQLKEVLDLNDEAIETEPASGLIYDVKTAVISGIYQGEYGNLVLLNIKTLFQQLDAILPLIWDAQMQLESMVKHPNDEVEPQLEQELLQESKALQTSKIIPDFYDLYCHEATIEERAIFRQRADDLRQQTESLKVTKKLMPMAVISWGEEYYGLDLELVLAFTKISNLTPIPCCPNHIVGNINLRGEIVTLIDIRNTLNLPTTPINVSSNVVVVQVDDIVAGLPVDQVLEMTYLNSADMTLLSGTLPDLGEQYLQGTAFFQEKMLKVLDLPKIFSQGGLVVNADA